MTRMLLITLLVLSHGPVYAEWAWVDRNMHGMSAYADPDTIDRKGDLVKMWVLFDYKTVLTVAGKSYGSNRVQDQYDCADQRSRMLSLTWFAGNMGTGDIRFHDDEGHKWRPVPPGSIIEALRNFACSK